MEYRKSLSWYPYLQDYQNLQHFYTDLCLRYQPLHVLQKQGFQAASSGGHISHKNSPTRRANKGSSGGKKGGGGGSSKAKTPSTVKTQTPSEAKTSITDRSDPYHDVNLALENQEDLLDDIQKEQKKLVNRDRLKNLQQQNKQLEKQKSLLDQKSGIAASQLVRLRNEIVSDLGNAIKFDKNGQIANYNAALDKARDNYNDSIAEYNKKVADAETAYNNYVAQYNAMSAQTQEANKTELERQKDIMDATKKEAEKALKGQFEYIEDVRDYNQEKVLNAFIENKVAPEHFYTV